MSLLVKKTLYVLKKDQKLAGILNISPTHIEWEPHDPTRCQPVSVALSSVPDSLQRAKGKPMLRVPLTTGALVFEFETEVDRDQAVDVITPLLQQAQRKGKGVASVGAGPLTPVAAASGPQAALKAQLLREDRDLQQLYNQLVMAGVLTEDEFWKGRQGMLKQRMQGGSTQKQLRGYQNAMVSEQALSNGGSTVTLKMTPELKQQLFEEKPHIRRAYTALVPQSVSEKDFWQRFFQYEFARKSQSGKAANELEDPYKDFMDQEQDIREARSRLSFVDPTVNLATDGFDRDEDSSATAGAQDARLGDSSKDVIRDINKHAAVVMQGLPLPGAGTVREHDPDGRLTRSREASALGKDRAEGLLLEDLRGPWVAGFSELRIQDPRRCYEGIGSAGALPLDTGTGMEEGGAEHVESALRQVQELRSQGIASPVVDAGSAERVLSQLCQQWSSASLPLGGAQAMNGDPAQLLVPQLQSVLRETVLTSNELLRHFWGAFPLTSPAREARALRLKQALADQFDRTTAMQESSHGTERAHITQLLRPLRHALDTALAKHDREVDLRKAGQQGPTAQQ